MNRTILFAALLPALTLGGAGQAKELSRGAARVQLLDFTSNPGGDGFTARAQQTSVVEANMVSDFSGEFSAAEERGTAQIEGQQAEPFNVMQRDGAGFVRSAPIFVPAWMRSGRARLASQMMPTGLPAIGNCGARDYSASGLLKAVGEERRRVLYPLVVQYACRYGIPVGLFDAMIIQESGYNALISSPKGAFGLGQLMPGTAAQLGVDRYSIYGNLDGAARYLASHLREFNQPSLALAAYNAGPGRVRKVWRVPRISETQDYVRTIMWNWQALEQQATR